jgi:steroid 5-alpha reductase family enzyme
MLDFTAALSAFGAVVLLAAVAWLLGTVKRDVSIVDSIWPLFFLLAAIAYISSAELTGPRVTLLVVLVAIWALRLSTYLTWRNWGEPEDRRYQDIRQRNEPGFGWKSLYLVFGLQGLLAWIIAFPVYVGATEPSPLNALDYAGASLWTFGLVFESVADWQLARFKADPNHRGEVLDTGLWRYTRHPNYFGEATLWWGIYLIALAADGWWTVFGPLLMTVLLLKVSGVTLLEADIQERRPGYRAYIERTNAFFPWYPQEGSG